MARPANPNGNHAVINVRLPQAVKDRLQFHANVITKGSASALALKGITVLVDYLDQQLAARQPQPTTTSQEPTQ